MKPIAMNHLNKDKIEALIPHAGVMCLIDRVDFWDQNSIHCSSASHLLEQHPLRLEGELSCLHLLEYGAQAMAIHGGLLTGAVKPGVLAAVRDVNIYVDNLPLINTPIIITANVEINTKTGSSYQFTITDTQDNTLLSARATVIIHSE